MHKWASETLWSVGLQEVVTATIVGPQSAGRLDSFDAVFGGSAGALVFGSTIATCAHLDKNESALAELAGLKLCHGRALWVHAGEDDRQRISAFMAATPSEVLAVPENTAVYVQADTIASLGEGQVWRWTTTGRDAGFAVDAEPGTRMTLGDAAPTNV